MWHPALIFLPAIPRLGLIALTFALPTLSLDRLGQTEMLVKPVKIVSGRNDMSRIDCRRIRLGTARRDRITKVDPFCSLRDAIAVRTEERGRRHGDGKVTAPNIESELGNVTCEYVSEYD